MSEPIPAALAQPTVLLGVESLAGWLASQQLQSVAVFVDSMLAESELARAVCESVVNSGCVVTVDALTPSTSLIRLTTLAGRLLDVDAVIGVGGGSVLDQAKLAAAIAGDPSVESRLRHHQRAGWVTLPHLAARVAKPRLILIPTTIGTGSELSSAACLDGVDGKRLVAGPSLLPDAALLAGEATRTLPRPLLMEGIFEAFSRVVGPYAGSHHDLPLEDGLAEVVAARLATLGHQALGCSVVGDSPSDAVRLELARLSGLTHSSWLVLGRSSHAYKAWFLATEVSQVAGCRKVPALAAVLPPIWRRIVDGCGALGSDTRLHRIWRCVAATAPGWLPADPVTGIAALAHRWGVGATLRFDPATVVRRALRRWGAGLPMLAGLSPSVLRAIIDESLDPGDTRQAPGRSPHNVLAGVSRGGVDDAASSFGREG